MENLTNEIAGILEKYENELKEAKKITDQDLRAIQEEVEALRFFNFL